MFAFSSFLPKPAQEFIAKAPSAAAAVPAETGFAESPRSAPIEQLTMAALVILSGLTLANSILAA
jgi:hypothetical protein